MNKRKCEICGREITSGYAFDGAECFCSKECAAKFFNDDAGCVEILIDDEDRLVWMDELPTPPHYKVNVGCCDDDFFYTDDWRKAAEWLSKKVGQEIRTGADAERYNLSHWQVPIEIIVFEPKSYFRHRREYLAELRRCDDLLHRIIKMDKSPKRDRLFCDYTFAYENANQIKGLYEEVWQGEV